MCENMFGLLSLHVVLGWAQATATAADPVPLRLPIDPNNPMHIQGSNSLIPPLQKWHVVPADLRPISILQLDNNDNGTRAVRFEKILKDCQEHGIPMIAELVRAGRANDTINSAWAESMLRKYPVFVAIGFGCNAPDQLNTAMMREYLEICGRNGAYFLYNMSSKTQTFPEDLDKMVADPELVASMKQYHQNIVVGCYGGGYDMTLTEVQKAQNVEKLKKMQADGLIGRIGYFYKQMGAADVDRERANGCTAFGSQSQYARADYWAALRRIAQVKMGEPPPLRWKIDPNKPIHVHGYTVLRDLVAAWRLIPEDMQPISLMYLHNYDNTSEAGIFEDCFVECQKHGIPVVPELVRYGGRNASVHAAWLDSMLKKYPAIAGVAFGCNAPDQLDTAMMREYLDVCGENGAYFFFDVGNKSCTLPESLDKILADADLVATMKRYHQNIVMDYYAGGQRGEPTAAQKAENLEKVKKMLVEGLIGRIAYYRASMADGSEVECERANGCSVFGGNEPGRASAEYWDSLRKRIETSSAGAPAGQPRAVVRSAQEITFPDDGDCNSPLHWDGDTLYIFGSNAGQRVTRAGGPDLFNLQRPPVGTTYDNAVEPYHGGRGRWIEATYKDADGKLYGWYHMELPRGKYHDHIEQGKIVVCPADDPNKIVTVCLIGAVVSTNNGMNWHDLGIVLKAPDDSLCCDTPNHFFAGGNGDCSVILDQQKEYFYFFISTYNKDIKEQGVAVARMACADRANPVGKVFKWHKGTWEEPGLGGHVTPIFPAKSSWHVPPPDRPDAFWGPAVHWNSYLKQYVILLSRSLGRIFEPEGIYVTFNPDLSKPGQWTEPAKILDASELPGRGYYPQVVGTNVEARETDKLAGKVARLFVFNTSKWEIEFSFDGNSAAASADTKPSASAAGQGGVLRPKIDGPWWTVAHSPDLGAMTSPDQQPVDFAVWQAADGSWQICSCIRGTKCGGRTRLFYRWEGQRLTDSDWRPMGIAMQSEPKYGEMAGGLQAPHVVKIGEKYVMAYGDSEHICLAESRDGKQFERVVQPNGKTGLFAEGKGNRTRDAMLIRIGDRWHCYYTAYPNDEGWAFCRTSTDLMRWSDSVKVAFGGQAGTGPHSAECPFVVAIGGRYYLFRTQYYGQNALTTIYHSTDPMDFGVNNDREHLVGTLPVAAPEIVLYQGQYYIAALRSDLKGIQIARLKWVPANYSNSRKELPTSH